MTYDHDAKKVQWRKTMLENQISICKIMNIKQYLILYEKINTKWIIDPNAKHKSIKLLGENHCDIWLNKDFQTQHWFPSQNNKFDKMGFFKIKELLFERHCKENEKTSHQLREKN